MPSSISISSIIWQTLFHSLLVSAGGGGVNLPGEILDTFNDITSMTSNVVGGEELPVQIVVDTVKPISSNIFDNIGNERIVTYQPPVSNGFDYYGNDLANYPTSDPAYCAANCETTAGCVGFVVATEIEGCWLKSAFVNPTPRSNRQVYLKLGTTLPPTRKYPRL